MAKKTAAAGSHLKGKKERAAAEQQPDAGERGPTTEERFAAFSARYQWYFIVPLVAAIVVVVVLAVGSNQRTKRRRASLAAFESAGSVEQYDAVAREYARSFVGGRALVEAGDLLYAQGHYAEARHRYEAYLKAKPDPELAMLAWTAIVQTYIGEGNYAAGIKACEQALGSEEIGAEGRQIAERQLFYYTAYCYELSGDLKNASEWYDKLLKGEEAGGPWAMLADRRVDGVDRRLKAQKDNEPKNPEKDIDTTAND